MTVTSYMPFLLCFNESFWYIAEAVDFFFFNPSKVFEMISLFNWVHYLYS